MCSNQYLFPATLSIIFQHVVSAFDAMHSMNCYAHTEDEGSRLFLQVAYSTSYIDVRQGVRRWKHKEISQLTLLTTKPLLQNLYVKSSHWVISILPMLEKGNVLFCKGWLFSWTFKEFWFTEMLGFKHVNQPTQQFVSYGIITEENKI